MIKLSGSMWDFNKHPLIGGQEELCIFFVDMANQFGLRHSVFADGIIDPPFTLSVEGKRKNASSI